MLDRPTTADDLYLARGAEARSFRPIMQGDVFEGIEIPGVEGDPSLAVVLTHPCSMRAGGGHLRPHLLMSRVALVDQIGLDAWPTGFYGVMPLPALTSTPDPSSHAATFEMQGRVASEHLAPSDRVACLSREGILLLQQRLVYSLTRVLVPLHRLSEVCEPVLEEADLLEEWLEKFASDGESSSVHREEARFDALMGTVPSGTNSLRQRLVEPTTRADVRRSVRRAIAEGRT